MRPRRCWQSTVGNPLPANRVSSPRGKTYPISARQTGSTGGASDLALSIPRSLQGNFHVLIPSPARELLPPLYQQDAVGREQVVQTESFQFSLAIDAIKVNVIQRGPRTTIFMD